MRHLYVCRHVTVCKIPTGFPSIAACTHARDPLIVQQDNSQYWEHVPCQGCTDALLLHCRLRSCGHDAVATHQKRLLAAAIDVQQVPLLYIIIVCRALRQAPTTASELGTTQGAPHRLMQPRRRVDLGSVQNV